MRSLILFRPPPIFKILFCDDWKSSFLKKLNWAHLVWFIKNCIKGIAEYATKYCIPTAILVGFIFLSSLILPMSLYSGCNCSVGSPNIIGQTNTTTSISSYTGSVLSPGCYVIKGNVEININVLVDNCTFEMEAGSQITILSLKRLTVSNSNLHSCDTLWKGIRTLNGGRVWISDSEIRDAQYAVRAEGTSYVTMYNNDFLHNYVGFYIPTGNSSTAIQNVRLLCQNNTYDNPATLTLSAGSLRFPNYSGMSPDPAGKAYAGFLINNANVIIGSQATISPLFRNYISNFKVGVYGTYSNLECHQLIISNMLSHSVTNWTFDKPVSVGILVKYSSLKATHDTITNAIAGISGYYSKLNDISFNEISEVQVGVNDRNSAHTPVILNNEIHHVSDFGIQIILPTALIGPLISYNQISTNGTTPFRSEGFFGIKLFLLGHRSLGSVISWNEINVHSNSIGIDIRDCTNIGVGYNTIEFSDYSDASHAGVGILHMDSRDGFIIENNVISGGDNGKPIGFHSYNGRNNQFCCNVVDGMDYGYQFIGNCTRPNGFSHNEIRGINGGLILASSTLMGLQNHQGNNWNGSFPSPTQYKGGAINNGIGKEIQNSIFNVQTCNTPLWPYNIYPIQSCNNSAGNWFFLDDGYAPSCENDASCDPEFLASDRDINFADIDSGDEYVARGQMAAGEYGFSLDYEARRHLLERMYFDAGSHSQNGYVDSFYTASSSSSYADLLELQLEIDTMLSYTSTQQSILNAAYSGIKYSSDSIRVLDSLLVLAGSEGDSISITNLRVSQLVSMDTFLQDYLEVLYDHIDQIVDTKDDLLYANSLISPDNIIDTNEIVTNEVYLNYLGEDDYTFTIGQTADLEEVAEQCPRLGGSIVYKARGLYQLIDDPIYDDLACLDTSMAVRNRIIHHSDAIVRISPNPNSGILNIYFDSPDSALDHWLELVDMQGKISYKLKLEKTKKFFTLNLDTELAGNYLLRIVNSNKIEFADKILILR